MLSCSVIYFAVCSLLEDEASKTSLVQELADEVRVCTAVDLSIADTLGSEVQYVMQRFPLFRGFLMHIICLDPQKQSVIERFPLLGEFVI